MSNNGSVLWIEERVYILISLCVVEERLAREKEEAELAEELAKEDADDDGEL